MVIFKSRQPEIDLSTEITDWDWLLNSSYSTINNYPESQLAGYQNAVTKERVNWKQVKEYPIYISTALVKKIWIEGKSNNITIQPEFNMVSCGYVQGPRIGAMILGASLAYNTEEMSYALKTAQARFLMTTPGSIEVAATSAKAAGIPKQNVFLLEGELPGYITIQDLIRIGKSYGEKAIRETFNVDGWLHTGDKGAIDEEGMIHILDRIKEMIKVKGIGVAPAELENLLLGHPKVEDVAVMGVKDDYAGELPKAFVVLKSGVEANEKVGKELMLFVDRFVRRRVA